MIAQELPHTTTPIEHLQSCVSLTRPKEHWLCQPFGLTWKGALRSAATDGHALLLLKQVLPGIEDAREETRLLVDNILSIRPRIATTVALPSLLSFLSHGLPESPPICPRCKGKKPPTVQCERCDGSGEIECFECGHERGCPDCSGNGRIGGCVECDKTEDAAAKPLTGEVAPGVFVDRRLLSRVLGPLRPPRILMRYDGAFDPVTLENESGDWFAVVMPLRRPDGPDSDIPALASASERGAP